MSRGNRKSAVVSAVETLAAGPGLSIVRMDSCHLSRDEKPGALLSCLWAGEGSQHKLCTLEESCILTPLPGSMTSWKREYIRAAPGFDLLAG